MGWYDQLVTDPMNDLQDKISNTLTQYEALQDKTKVHTNNPTINKHAIKFDTSMAKNPYPIGTAGYIQWEEANKNTNPNSLGSGVGLVNNAMLNQQNLNKGGVDYNKMATDFDETNPEHVTGMQTHLSQEINPETNLPYYLNKAGTGPGAIDNKWGPKSAEALTAFNQNRLNTNPQTATNQSIDQSSDKAIEDSQSEQTVDSSADPSGMLNQGLRNQKGPVIYQSGNEVTSNPTNVDSSDASTDVALSSGELEGSGNNSDTQVAVNDSEDDKKKKEDNPWSDFEWNSPTYGNPFAK